MEKLLKRLAAVWKGKGSLRHAMKKLRASGGIFRFWKPGRRKAAESQAEQEAPASPKSEEGGGGMEDRAPVGGAEQSAAEDEAAPATQAEVTSDADGIASTAAGADADDAPPEQGAQDKWLEKYRQLLSDSAAGRSATSAVSAADGSPGQASYPEPGMAGGGAARQNFAGNAATGAAPATAAREDKMEQLIDGLRDEMRTGFQALMNRKNPTVFT